MQNKNEPWPAAPTDPKIKKSHALPSINLQIYPQDQEILRDKQQLQTSATI
jgi:hypothetical protein